MKITVDYENGMQVNLKPENIQLLDNAGKNSVLIFKTELAAVPIMFFPALLATPDEIKARQDVANLAAKAAAEAQKEALVEAASAEIEKKRAHAEADADAAKADAGVPVTVPASEVQPQP